MEDIIMRVRHSKLLALIGAGILAVTTLVACGNGDATTAQPSAVESSAAESTVAASSEAAPAETTAVRQHFHGGKYFYGEVSQCTE